MTIDLVKPNQYLTTIEKHSVNSKPFKWLISTLITVAIVGFLIMMMSDDSVSKRQCDQLAINGIITNVTDCVILKQIHRRDAIVGLILYSLLSSHSSHDDDDDY